MPPLSRRRALQLGAVAGTGLVGVPPVGRPCRRPPPAARLPPRRRLRVTRCPTPSSCGPGSRPRPRATPGSGLGPAVSVTWEVATDPAFRQDRPQRHGAHRRRPRPHRQGRRRAGSPRRPATGTASAARRRSRRWAARAPPRPPTPPSPGCAWPSSPAPTGRPAGSAPTGTSPRAATWTWSLHLGDYLYEYAPGEYQARDVVVRPHDPPREMVGLADYRRRHAQYKTDPDLQALHAAAPWVVTWDDHESANDSWSGGAENHTEGAEGAGRTRRPYAQQAYAEWMPVRYDRGRAALPPLPLRPAGQPVDARPAHLPRPAGRLAGRSRAGRPGPHASPGPQQLDFLLDGLADPSVQWKLVGNPVMIAPVRFPTPWTPTPPAASRRWSTPPRRPCGVPYNVDQWDGYPADRRGCSPTCATAASATPSSSPATSTPAGPATCPPTPTTYPADGDSVGVELVCTSVTSDNLDDILNTPPRTASLAVETAFKANNPHVKYLDFDSHGFSVLEVTPAGSPDGLVRAHRPHRPARPRRSARRPTGVPAGRQQASEPAAAAARVSGATLDRRRFLSSPAAGGAAVVLSTALGTRPAAGHRPAEGLRAGRRRHPARRDHPGADAAGWPHCAPRAPGSRRRGRCR